MGYALLRSCGTAVLTFVLCIGGVATVTAQTEISEPRPAWGASLGVVTIPAHSLYQGRLYLQSGGLVHGATYIERAANVVGVRADVRFRAISGTMMSLGVYGTRGTSTAQYTGIAGPETMTRSLDVAGVDAGWQPGVFESPMLSVRVPVGPSLAWQKLHLSEGHRDAYATPGGGPVEDVDWSDRTWTSIGGHIGMAVSMHTSSHFDVFLTGRGRFLFNRGSGAWGDRERADIQRSTGNTVTITYTDRVVLQSGLEAGVEWRP